MYLVIISDWYYMLMNPLVIRPDLELEALILIFWNQGLKRTQLTNSWPHHWNVSSIELLAKLCKWEHFN